MRFTSYVSTASASKMFDNIFSFETEFKIEFKNEKSIEIVSFEK